MPLFLALTFLNPVFGELFSFLSIFLLEREEVCVLQEDRTSCLLNCTKKKKKKSSPKLSE